MEKALQYCLGDDDIRTLLGSGIRITNYTKLHEKHSINELFDRQGRGVLFYPQQNEQQGHWCCLIRKGREIEFFDPYGDPPDFQKDTISDRKLEQMNMDEPYLLRLLKNSNCKVIFNKEPLQELKNNISTCGRHIVCRLLHFRYPLRRYREIIRRSGNTPDEFVVKMTYENLGK